MTTKSLDSEVLISVDGLKKKFDGMENHALCGVCLLYTSDAADER